MEHSRFPILVADLIPLQDRAALELPVGITGGKLRAFLDAEVEDAGKVYENATPNRISSDCASFRDFGFVPNADSVPVLDGSESRPS